MISSDTGHATNSAMFEMNLSDLKVVLNHVIAKSYEIKEFVHEENVTVDDYWTKYMTQHRPWNELSGIFIASAVLPPSTNVYVSAEVIERLYRYGVRYNSMFRRIMLAS